MLIYTLCCTYLHSQHNLGSPGTLLYSINKWEIMEPHRVHMHQIASPSKCKEFASCDFKKGPSAISCLPFLTLFTKLYNFGTMMLLRELSNFLCCQFAFLWHHLHKKNTSREKVSGQEEGKVLELIETRGFYNAHYTWCGVLLFDIIALQSK